MTKVLTLGDARKRPYSDKRICGIHIQRDGQVAAVWLSLDKDSDTLHLYDSILHEREVIAVQAESIKRRGKRIPVAWHEDGKEIVNKLLEHGVNTLPEGVKHSEAVAEATALDVWERMRTGRFKVKKDLTEWQEEFKTFQREEGAVPLDTHPLMNATLHAVAQIDWAKNQESRPVNYQQVAIV